MPENLKNLPNAEETSESDEKPSEILIYDVIGHDWWTGEGVTSKGIIKALEQVKTDKLVVRINSPGGDVFEGFAIYEAFKGFDGHIEMRVDSLAASAASFIAMAGDEIVMGEAAYMMIHDPWSGVLGTAEDMRAEADLLDKITGTIAELYVNKTGSNLKDIKKLMRAETWMAADEAVDMGFADRKREEKNSKAMAFDLSKFNYKQVPSALQRGQQQVIPTRRDIERTLMQDAKLSRSQTRAILSKGYKALYGTQDAADEGDQSLNTAPLLAEIRSTIAMINNL